MLSSRALAGLGAAVLLVLGGPLGAQQVDAVRAGAAPRRPAAQGSWAPGARAALALGDSRLGPPPVPVPSRRRVRRTPYVLGGAAIGAAADYVLVRRSARDCARDGCMLFPAVAAVAVAVPAGGGALAGLLVSEAVRARGRP